MKRQAYRIEYAAEAEEQLQALSPRDSTTVLKTNPVAPWELRIGHLRVYFDVQEEPERVVKIRAVGLKDRNRVLIGGEEIELR
jgi:mRNA-degrading endonuclease RelE of RelBE toxin-antitoxin system